MLVSIQQSNYLSLCIPFKLCDFWQPVSSRVHFTKVNNQYNQIFYLSWLPFHFSATQSPRSQTQTREKTRAISHCTARHREKKKINVRQSFSGSAWCLCTSAALYSTILKLQQDSRGLFSRMCKITTCTDPGYCTSSISFTSYDFCSTGLLSDLCKYTHKSNKKTDRRAHRQTEWWEGWKSSYWLCK